MRAFDEYLERLCSLRPNIHMHGELIKRDDPRLRPAMNNIKLTFDLAQDPKLAPLMTTTSHVTGEKINRFCHINRSQDDLLKKQEMTRMACQRTPACIQRCMGVDMLNALSVATHEIDQAKKTEYYPRFIEYLKYFQKNDLVGCAGQTDVKGDRSLRPHEQPDPDMYLRIVEKKKEGIVVRGAKAHNSIAAYADEIIVTPTRALTKEE
ncbi:MAG TPA: 4-hydroxyphenylacetate 3-hydroxylase N-terminal domain-containing protein, partial [Dehalococcoidales bacterium]